MARDDKNGAVVTLTVLVTMQLCFALLVTLLRPNTSRLLNIVEAVVNWLEAAVQALALVAHKHIELQQGTVGLRCTERPAPCCRCLPLVDVLRCMFAIG
jgi:hypothetical protein